MATNKAKTAVQEASAVDSENAAGAVADGQEGSTATANAKTDTTEASAVDSENTAGSTSDGQDRAVRSLIVSARIEGFRRAGRPWSKAPTQVSVDVFSEEQLAALADEPMLQVVFSVEEAQ